MEISVKTAKNGKIKIYADGEELFTVPAVIWYSSHLREGDDVSPEELTQLKRLGFSSFAFESALRMLSLRAHSEYELRLKLTQKFSREAAEDAVSKLRASGLLDDEKFALMLAEELYTKKGYAAKRIAMELKNRGISDEYSENAINSLDIDSEIGIIKIIEKSGIDESSSEKEKQRVIRKLINMGYSFYEISKHINIYE